MPEPPGGTPHGSSRIDPLLAAQLTVAEERDILTVVITVSRTPGQRVNPDSTRSRVNSAIAAACADSELQPARVQVLAYLSRAVVQARPAFLRALLRQPEVTTMALTEPPG